MRSEAGLEAILSHCAIRHVALAIDRQDCVFRQVLKQVTHAKNNHLMGQDKYAAPTVVQAHRIERATQTKDHIAPALTSRGTVIELAEKPAEFGLLRMQLLDARASEPVEDAELFFTQPFVYDERLVLGERKSARLAYQRARGLRPQIRRSHHNVGPSIFWLRCEPLAKREGLAFPERAQGHVHIPGADLNTGEPGRARSVSRDISRAFPVTDDP